MDAVELPSPNFDERPRDKPVDILLLHYTGLPTAQDALERLTDPAAKVSAHYTVDEDGTIYRHVPENKRAWHAGVSCWAGERDVNGVSVGIEIVNPGHEFGYRPFPAVQMAAVIALARGIVARHSIPAHRVLGHSDVAPGRKQDPGELFDWAGLAEAGVGLWPDGASHVDSDVGRLQTDLRSFGYDCPLTGTADEKTVAVVTAFQRHFRPDRVDGRPDSECAGIARWLAEFASGG